MLKVRDSCVTVKTFKIIFYQVLHGFLGLLTNYAYYSLLIVMYAPVSQSVMFVLQ